MVVIRRKMGGYMWDTRLFGEVSVENVLNAVEIRSQSNNHFT